MIPRTLAALATTLPAVARAADLIPTTGDATRTGLSAIWFLANISYAGMRAQNADRPVWRIIAFLLGLPGTIVTYLVVREGGERAYGIELPRRKAPGGEG
ncbi:MAG TPA: hypothetical protein PLD37_12720 [Usitatibacteraceae bacterium]|jgi:hypothetical protein|nr:hypothetical protein [Usitatibacteraceae bacterium]